MALWNYKLQAGQVNAPMGAAEEEPGASEQAPGRDRCSDPRHRRQDGRNLPMCRCIVTAARSPNRAYWAGSSRGVIDPGRLDRDVAGLGLDSLEGHARFAQAGSAGMAELMTVGSFQSGSLAGTAHDHVDSLGAQTLTAAGAFQGDKGSIGRCVHQTLAAQVVAHRGEEHVRDRRVPRTAALPSATNNERSATWMSRRRSPRTSQRRSPPSAMAKTIARSR